MFKNTFYLVRHGETAWNAEGRFQGWTDVPLSDRGRGQAGRNARNLREHLSTQPAEAFPVSALASPLGRCVETLDILADAIGIPAQCRVTDDRLREASFGHWEGLTTLEVKERFPDERRHRKQDRWNFSPAGGRSFADLERSAVALMAELEGRGPTLIVAHSGNLRVMLGVLMGWSKPDAVRFAVPHDMIFVHDGDRLTTI